jgi:hypothetical protein
LVVGEDLMAFEIGETVSVRRFQSSSAPAERNGCCVRLGGRVASFLRVRCMRPRVRWFPKRRLGKMVAPSGLRFLGNDAQVRPCILHRQPM